MAPRLLLSTAAAGLSALALQVAAPSPAASLRALGSLEQAVDASDPLVAVASLLAWALLAHLLLVALLTLVTALPGRTGALGDVALLRCAPAGLRRAVALALGVGLLVGTGAGAASAAPAPSPTASTSAASLDWPVAVDAGLPSPPALPSLDWPAPVEVAATPAATAAPATTAAPAAPDASPAPAVAVTPPAATPSEAPNVVQVAGPAPQRTGEVSVAPGDSLWSLARAELPADATAQEVAQAWPSWWAANRAVIGDDPDLIHPGQSLRAPR